MSPNVSAEGMSQAGALNGAVVSGVVPDPIVVHEHTPFSGTHAQAATSFLQDRAHAQWHDQAVWWVRQKRDVQSKGLPEWEVLRDLADRIKAHTLSHLDRYIDEFSRKAQANGVVVHFASTAQEHNEIVHSILAQASVRKLVKSKSMLTEECGLNPYLEARGIEVVDTDLGERIVQLRHEKPSHIVMPAIHLKKEQIGTLFEQALGTEPGNFDPTYLTHAARANLRAHFMGAGAGLTGVNFGIAQTGGIVVCTNEGNADLGVSLPPIQIASMGIEKMIPKLAHLSVFTRLLARSAIGSPITAFTSHFHKPMAGGQMHIILVDNGRSAILGQPEFAKSLQCIRCGACINTCPVYRRSSGMSYSYVIPGPIGINLGSVRDLNAHGHTLSACTTCGSCNNVCPVKIDLKDQIVAHRGRAFEAKTIAPTKWWALRVSSFLMRHPLGFSGLGWLQRTLIPWVPERWLVHSAWHRYGRTTPNMPKQSFKQLMKQRRKS